MILRTFTLLIDTSCHGDSTVHAIEFTPQSTILDLSSHNIKDRNNTEINYTITSYGVILPHDALLEDVIHDSPHMSFFINLHQTSAHHIQKRGFRETKFLLGEPY